MAAFVGSDNDLFKSAGIEKNLTDLCECVKSLKITYEDTGIPIDDDNVTFHRMCEKMEYLLSVGLRESSGMFGKTRSPWHYMNACLAKLKNVNDGLRFVRGVSELKTPSGKLRSFLRFCLVHHCLADTAQQCIMQHEITESYYNQNSLLLKKNLTASFIATLYELNEIQFDLAPTGYDLDVGWPSFARKQFGNYNWKPSTSSRFSGGASLVFSVSQDSQSVNSYRSELTSPLSPLMPLAPGETNLFNSTMAGTRSNSSSSPDRVETDGLIATIRSLTDDKEELGARVDSLTQQLEQEKENGRNAQLRMEAELTEWKEKFASLELRLDLAEKQVSPVNLESLRQAEALTRKMLAVRDGEVHLLKAQLESTEAKLDASKERYTLQKTLIMEEVRKLANQLAGSEHLVQKWKDLAINWAELDHAEDIKTDLEGAEPLEKRLKQLLSDKKGVAKELEALKEANTSLVKALAQHGNRLSSVTNQLDQTWAWLSKLKLQASRLQTDESVMRCELKEKRQLLDGLKEQLEDSRRQWERIRASNVANQEQWQSIRDELDGRKGPSTTPEEVHSEEEEHPMEASIEEEEERPFVPPIDLVSDIAPVADGREERLQLMEQQCRSLYAKLVNTTSRNAQLVGRLASLHQHYSTPKELLPAASVSPVEDISPPVHHQDGAQRLDAEQLLADREKQLATLKEELQAVKFDRDTKQLEQERSNQAYQQQQEQLQSALERLKGNETLIRTLQEKLESLTGRSHEERHLLDAELRKLELRLMTRDEECEELVNELRSAMKEMDQLRTQHDELNAAFQHVKSTESRLKMDNQLLKDESQMLRNKVIELVKEKDSLWQRSDRLLHLQRVQATDQWLSDSSIRDCQGCQTKFTLFVRRHHCRLCGRIFCHNCSDHWLSIAASSRPERTCPECFSIHRQFSQPESDVGTFLAVKNTEEEESSTVTTAQDQTGEPCTEISNHVQSPNECAAYPISENNDSEEKNIRTAECRSFESLIAQEVNPPFSEVLISASMVYRIPLLVTMPGCSLHWKFKTDPKSVAFAVVGSDSMEEGGKEVLDRIIMETALHKSEEEFIEGEALLALPGTYYVYFDNSFSRFSANKVTFQLGLSLPERIE